MIIDLYKAYYLNGIEHKKNGPAWISYFTNGNIDIETYIKNGVRHREDGPAWIDHFMDGRIHKKLYYLNDKVYSEEDYIKQLRILKIKKILE